MTKESAKAADRSTEEEHFLGEDWFDPLENGVRTRILGFIEGLLEAEPDAALGRARYQRDRVDRKGAVGSRGGRRERSLLRLSGPRPCARRTPWGWRKRCTHALGRRGR